MLGIFKNYIDKRLNLLKLETTENVVKAISIAIYTIILLILGIAFFLFLFVGIGIGLGKYLGNYVYGFLAVSGFFLLWFFTLLLFKNQLIMFLKGKFIKVIYSKK